MGNLGEGPFRSWRSCEFRLPTEGQASWTASLVPHNLSIQLQEGPVFSLFVFWDRVLNSPPPSSASRGLAEIMAVNYQVPAVFL